jgi:hypothetical protein
MLVACRLAGLSALRALCGCQRAHAIRCARLQPFLVRAVTLGALLGPIITRRPTERPGQPPGPNPYP